jgi:hypothetical protein
MCSLSPKGCAAGATRRPVLDHLVELLERKQAPVPAFVPGLAAGTAPARWRPRPRRRRGRIPRGRQRGVARGGAAADRAHRPQPQAAGSPRPARPPFISGATAISRSTSRIASASGCSTPTNSPHRNGSLSRDVNAYACSTRCRCLREEISSQSRHSRRALPTQRSGCAFAVANGGRPSGFPGRSSAGG